MNEGLKPSVEKKPFDNEEVVKLLFMVEEGSVPSIIHDYDIFLDNLKEGKKCYFLYYFFNNNDEGVFKKLYVNRIHIVDKLKDDLLNQEFRKVWTEQLEKIQNMENMTFGNEGEIIHTQGAGSGVSGVSSSASSDQVKKLNWPDFKLELKNVPGDGNCFFYALGCELNRLKFRPPEGGEWPCGIYQPPQSAADKTRIFVQQAVEKKLVEDAEYKQIVNAAIITDAESLNRPKDEVEFLKYLGPIGEETTDMDEFAGETRTKWWADGQIIIEALIPVLKEIDNFKGIIIWTLDKLIHHVLAVPEEEPRSLDVATVVKEVKQEDDSEIVHYGITLVDAKKDWDKWIHLAHTGGNHYEYVRLVE